MKLSGFIAICLLLFVTSVTHAQDASPSGNRLRNRLQSQKERLETKMEQREIQLQERLDQKRERIASKEARLKERLSVFKDRVKAQRTERVNTILENINQRRTTHMLQLLDKMASITAKLQDRVKTAKTNGKDVVSAQNAIDSARAAIETARTAVEEQSVKDYTIEVADETTVKEVASTARDNLKNDLKAIHTLMVIARQKVANAISTTVSSIGGKNGE